MYYKKIDNFIKSLNKDNIEELKPQLIKYVGELSLGIKDEQNKLSLDDIEGMFSLLLAREEVQDNVNNELKEQNSRFGLLTEEFMKSYKEFTEEIVQNGYLHNAIDLTRSCLGASGCIYRDVLLVRNHAGSAEERCKYIQSKEYLEELEQQLHEHLSQYVRSISREQLNILGLVNYIKAELKERVYEATSTILTELKNKSLEDFNKENHIGEYKAIFNIDYIEELKRREYSWNILSSKLQEAYFRDELYKDLG
jgi:hypothetical protein